MLKKVATKQRLTREAIAIRCAAEFQDGWLVNLGIGIPTLCSSFVPSGRNVLFHSENGVVGYGRLAMKEEVDIHLVNAGVQHITLGPGAFILDSATAFAIIRSKRLDAAVLGAYEIDEQGDLANYTLSPETGAQLGGAMDVATGAKRLYIVMQHTTPDGRPRLLKKCRLPITAKGVVQRVFTDLGLFDRTPGGYVLREIAPGWTPEEVQAASEAAIHISPDLKVLTA